MTALLREADGNGQSGKPAPPTRVAVIGFGYWGVNYVRVFSEMPDAHLAAVCDERPDRIAEAKRRFPDVGMNLDVEGVLNNPEIDAVVVATPATTHYELTRRALLAGKHVLVEKPLTTDSSHAAELVDISRSTERLLLVGHTFLYNEGVRVAKRFIKEGEVYYLYARRTCLGPIRQDVNAAW